MIPADGYEWKKLRNGELAEYQHCWTARQQPGTLMQDERLRLGNRWELGLG